MKRGEGGERRGVARGGRGSWIGEGEGKWSIVEGRGIGETRGEGEGKGKARGEEYERRGEKAGRKGMGLVEGLL